MHTTAPTVSPTAPPPRTRAAPQPVSRLTAGHPQGPALTPARTGAPCQRRERRQHTWITGIMPMSGRRGLVARRLRGPGIPGRVREAWHARLTLNPLARAVVATDHLSSIRGPVGWAVGALIEKVPSGSRESGVST